MKKKLVAILMAIALTVSLVACGNSNATSDTKQETKTSISEKETKNREEEKESEDKKSQTAEKADATETADKKDSKETSKKTKKPNNNKDADKSDKDKGSVQANSNSSVSKPSNSGNANNNGSASKPSTPAKPNKPSGNNSGSNNNGNHNGSVTKPSKPAEKPSKPNKPVEKPSEPSKPAPHVHAYNTVVSSTTGDCSHVGKVTKKCSCGATVTENGSYGDHNWQDQYKEIHHDAKYEDRPVYKWVAYHECRKCGFQTEDDDTILLHSLECGGTYTTKEKQVQTGTESVQIEKPWTERVPDGKKCTICGTHQ